ncbi:helix-turn-helix domain-containing protein [Flammeovirgaceae bacterium SG7u.111]|nr:helix-turn-helix domain-containing protein [Flammeovirgaceae bacterium SG7u.132]WPO38632.1 helix-turn-helix domain-containing protein [Flammeovirgaceae bacterium SG7u.111]
MKVLNAESIKIAPIIQKSTTKTEPNHYSVCWIQNGVQSIEINNVLYKDVSNAIFFMNPSFDWKIVKTNTSASSGYVLSLPQKTLDNPALSNLHINEVRLFANDEIPKINLAPGIEIRIQAILEMIDELVGSHLNHKDDAIISLLNTFFVYCDGQCNIKSVISENNAKKTVVYKFKKLVNQWFFEYHGVNEYAQLLNVSDKYLNECVNDILGVNAKSIITEQHVMRARHALKFTDKTVKEICFEMGFSSPDYFSYFLKKHTGMSPSMLRES